jgi:desulfoferrodoxin-like iron-binding protein
MNDDFGSSSDIIRGGAPTQPQDGSPMEVRRVSNELGKRYQCATCGTEVLCVHAGEGSLMCCGERMQTKGPQQLPASD